MSIIGIDLGTSNSLVAYWAESGPEIIPNVLGERLTPSIISIDDNGEILIGQAAKERLITHPQCTVAAFKRFMGTEKKFEIGRHYFSPEELSSFIIKSLKNDAEAFLGYEVTEAVISVPAYFNDTQRKATKFAAEIAGLKVERLISEPTAAALAYGLHLNEDESKFLVFDLGGGTFDVSILEYFEDILEVKSVAGDNFLGGEDFTQALVEYFISQHSLNSELLTKRDLSALYKQAEICKRELGIENFGEMNFTHAEETFSSKISQKDFEKIVSPLLIRLRKPVERALRDANIALDDIESVILIGGATKMPIIRSVTSKMFGKFPYTQINPDEAVALGAAIQAALIKRDVALKEMVMTDVCPFTLGIEICIDLGNGEHEDGHFSPIIERNSPIPISKVSTYYTISDNQREIKIEVYQGESRKTKDNIKLGEVNISVPPAPAEKETIDVRFTYDINGILEVIATTNSTKETKTLIIEQKKGSMTPEQIKQRLEKLKDIKIHPRDQMENRALLARGERLYEETIGNRRIIIDRYLRQFEAVLETQNAFEIKKAVSRLKKDLDELEKWDEF